MARIEVFEGKAYDFDRVDSHGLTLLVRQRRKPTVRSESRS
jgi:hypothetical protein